MMIVMGWLFGKIVGHSTTCDRCEMKELCRECRVNGEVPPCDQ